MNIRHMTRVVGIGILSLAIAGCGTSGNKTKEKNDGMKGISTVEKTSLKLYSAGEKTKDGMRVKNSDGTYTYGAANTDISKLRKEEDTFYNNSPDEGEHDVVAHFWLLDSNNKDYNNSVEFDHFKDDNKKMLISAELKFYIDDHTLQLYKDKGIIPANATKKNFRKMVESESKYIENLLRDDSVPEEDYDMNDKNQKEEYNLLRAGYFSRFVNKKPLKNEIGTSFGYDGYVEDVVEVLLSNPDKKGNFSGSIKFMFIDTIETRQHRYQILMNRYGIDSLLDKNVDEDKYAYNESRITSGILGNLMKLYTKDEEENVFKYSNIFDHRDYIKAQQKQIDDTEDSNGDTQ